MEIVGRDEEKFSHGELSRYISLAKQTLYDVHFDLHAVLQIDQPDEDCTNKELLKRMNAMGSRRQYRFYRDFVIFSEALDYAKQILEQSD